MQPAVRRELPAPARRVRAAAARRRETRVADAAEAPRERAGRQAQRQAAQARGARPGAEGSPAAAARPVPREEPAEEEVARVRRRARAAPPGLLDKAGSRAVAAPSPAPELRRLSSIQATRTRCHVRNPAACARTPGSAAPATHFPAAPPATSGSASTRRWPVAPPWHQTPTTPATRQTKPASFAGAAPSGRSSAARESGVAGIRSAARSRYLRGRSDSRSSRCRRRLPARSFRRGCR